MIAFFPARELETLTPDIFAKSACYQYNDLLSHFAAGAPHLIEAADALEKMAAELPLKTRFGYGAVSRHLSSSAHAQIRSIYFAFNDAVPIPRRPKDAMLYVRELRKLVADAKQAAISGEPSLPHLEFDLTYWEEWISALYVRVLTKWYGAKNVWYIGKFGKETQWAHARVHDEKFPPDYPSTLGGEANT
jgi:hypothetical protein